MATKNKVENNRKLIIIGIDGGTFDIINPLIAKNKLPILSSFKNKAILKSTSRIPYFEHLFDDVSGISTAQKIIDGQIVLRQIPFWINFIVSILLAIVIVSGVWLSIKVVERLNQKQNLEKSGNPHYLIPIVYGSIFLVMILVWRWSL